MKRLFECVEDRQGDELGVGYRLDADGWRKIALTWTENESVVKKLNEYKDDKLIAYIDETFEITLQLC